MSEFSFDGRPIPFLEGQSVAAALLATDHNVTRTTRRLGAPRGVFCGIGVCHDCLAVIDGQPDQRTCVTQATAGLRVATQSGSPEPVLVVLPVREAPLGEAGAPGVPRTMATQVVIIGAGPAGMSAAVAAAEAGVRVVVLDAEARTGGQYWRHGPGGVGEHHHDQGGWRRLSAAFQAAVATGAVMHLARHQVWRIDAPSSGTHHSDGGAGEVVVQALSPLGPLAVAAPAAVIATGAHDLVLPVPGWQLPGVFAAGGAQAMLKEHGVLVGRRVVVGGTGPFLLSLAAGLAQAGAKVVAVVEANGGARSAGHWARGWRSVLARREVLAEGAHYLAVLARHRVVVRPRTAVISIEGRDRVEAVVVAQLNGQGRPVAGSERRLECDAVALGWGFTPRRDLLNQTGPASGVFAAGDVDGLGGAPSAQVGGRLAGAAAAAHAVSRTHLPDEALVARRVAFAAFGEAMRAAHPVPPGWPAWMREDTIICRCEEVTLATLREAVVELGATDGRTAKLLTRCGMGWCQGRSCGEAVAGLVTALAGRDHDGGLGAADPAAAAAAAAATPRPVAVPVTLESLASSASEAEGRI